VEPAFGDFGLVGVLAKKTITFTVTNTGSDTLTIKSFGLNAMGPDFVVANPLNAMDTLAPGASKMFDVTFTPMAMGVIVAEVQMETDDAMAKNVRIPLDGTGAVSGLTVTPPTLVFPAT